MEWLFFQKYDLMFFMNRPVIFEFHTIGSVVKVNAFDELSLTEVSIQGPAGASEDILKKNALKKLEYILRKKGIIS
jgi:hypothetical protein